MKTKVSIPRILAAVFTIIVAILVAGEISKPLPFSVRRSVMIAAPPQKVYALLGDFHKWRLWSPYEEAGNTTERTFSGALSGAGAVYKWAGNNRAHSGKMQIFQTAAPDKIILIYFDSRYAVPTHTEFTLTGEGTSTRVTWSASGLKPFAMNLRGMFVNVDRQIGEQIQSGLNKLKVAAEERN